MTHPSSPPAPMTAERSSIERIRRAQILEPVGAQQFAQHTYASDIRVLLDQYDLAQGDCLRLGEEIAALRNEADALTARVATLERELAVERGEPTQAIIDGAKQLESLYPRLGEKSSYPIWLEERCRKLESELAAARKDARRDALEEAATHVARAASMPSAGVMRFPMLEIVRQIRALQTKDTTP